MIKILPIVRDVYPTTKFGIMVVHGVSNLVERTCMDTLKNTEINQIKQEHKEYERKSALNTSPICHYVSYYKSFKKTYPVLLQLESILLKDKGIPNVGIPVETMFLAEVKNMLLTAGHDLDQIKGKLTMNLAGGVECYQSISGKEQILTKNDLFLSDESGILSSILNGPDFRTQITKTTQNALYFVYGVEGVTEEQIRKHLENIGDYLTTVNPDVGIETIEVY
ncbi:MAG: hypothetical protein ACERKZ_09700 [Lachnotalea sp.]